MPRMLLVSALLLGPGWVVSASAQPQPCATTPAEPWRAARTIQSATTAESAATAHFDEAVFLKLHPDGEVAYATLPQGAGEAKSFGGIAAFTIEHAGAYRVGLSEPSWVDVVEDGKAVEAGKFGPGAACSGIRKAVEFDLKPGRHLIEISGNEDADIGVWVALVE